MLLDEIEKADPGVFDLLLQLIGEGRITDATGRTVRFTHTIVIMTSNLGASARDPVGFGDTRASVEAGRNYLQAAEAFFRPELVNRIDHLVPFAALDRPSLKKIAGQLLDAAIQREGLTRRRVAVRYDDAVLELLLERGYDPKYGARPMKRAVESLVMVPLAHRLATWPEGKIGTLELTRDGDAVTLQ